MRPCCRPGNGSVRSTSGRGPLLRCTFLRIRPAEHRLLFSMHHLISDGWSMAVLIRDLCRGMPRCAMAARWPGNLCRFSTAIMRCGIGIGCKGRFLASHMDYWRNVLNGAPERLAFP